MINGVLKRFAAGVGCVAVLMQSCPAEIHEIKSLREILPSIRRGTLLVFDLDNTLIEPGGHLGSDHWYYFLLRKYREVDHLDEASAARQAMVLWNQVQPSLRIRAVEPGTARLIQRQQEVGIQTLGLTARTSDIADLTIGQLRSAGIVLDRCTPFATEFDWWSQDAVKFKRGILLVGAGNAKGQVLAEFLRGIHFRPKRIVFVDDKIKHVREVEETVEGLGIKCVSFRYGATDAKVRQFDADTRDIGIFFGDAPASSSAPVATAQP